jgi:lipopolysaccharide exporter
VANPVHRPSAEGLTRTALGGVRWTYLSLAVSAVVQLVFTAVMSRLLLPLDFGVFAAAMVIVNLARHLGQLGLGPALVQKRTLTPSEIRTAFTLGGLLALAGGGFVILGARPLASLVGAPEARGLLAVLAADFVLTGLAITSVSLLRRSLRFRTLGFIEMGSSIGGYLVAGIGAALGGAGIWSLVIAVLVYDLLTLVLTYSATRHPLRPRLRRDEARPLLAYGGTLSIVGLLEYVYVSLDTVAIARFSGPQQLGQYNRAMALVSVPFNRLAMGLSRVLFPTFSTVQHERARIGRGYRLAFVAVGGLLAPLAGGLAAAAEELVHVLLGGQWAVAAALLPVVLITVTANTLAQFGGIVADSLNALGSKLLIQAASLVVLVAAVLMSAGRGVHGIAAAVAVVAILRLLANVAFASWLLDLALGRQLLDVAKVASGGILTYLAVRGVQLLVPELPALGMLALSSGAGLATLLVLWVAGPYVSTRHDLAARLVPLLSSPAAQRFARRLAGSR